MDVRLEAPLAASFSIRTAHRAVCSGAPKLGLQLQETGYQFESELRLGIYLTNTLEEAATESRRLFAKWISDEADAATKIEKDEPILVVLGNPPYSGHSANRSEVSVLCPTANPISANEKGAGRAYRGRNRARLKRKTFIGRLIEKYKAAEWKTMDKKNPKWLQDDYVKFIRFSQWRIDRTGEGIVAMITNHGYLDDPTLRACPASCRLSAQFTFTTCTAIRDNRDPRTADRMKTSSTSCKAWRSCSASNDRAIRDRQACIVVICGAGARRSTMPCGNGRQQHEMEVDEPSRRIIFLPSAIPGLPESIVTAIL